MPEDLIPELFATVRCPNLTELQSMSARGSARARSSWELVVDDTDVSNADDQLELEQPYDDDARMADRIQQD